MHPPLPFGLQTGNAGLGFRHEPIRGVDKVINQHRWTLVVNSLAIVRRQVIKVLGLTKVPCNAHAVKRFVVSRVDGVLGARTLLGTPHPKRMKDRFLTGLGVFFRHPSLVLPLDVAGGSTGPSHGSSMAANAVACKNDHCPSDKKPNHTPSS